MGHEMTSLDIRTHAKEELIDITASVKEVIKNSGIKKGICSIYIPHTTAGITINENADPSVKSDILMALRNVVPDSLPYRHGEGNSPGHVKSTLVGCSTSIFFDNSSPSLGTWQGVFFCEFDGPRNRKVYITLIPG
jgi:secondary thiamine-phosphate synthase enzyme